MLRAENALVGLPSMGQQNTLVSKPFLASLERELNSLTTGLQQASANAPTPALRRSLAATALNVSTLTSSGNEISSLDVKSTAAANGLAPLYRELGARCATVISFNKPTAHQRAEETARSIVQSVAFVAAATGRPFTQADVDLMIARAGLGQNGANKLTVTKPLGSIAQDTRVIEFKVTNLGGTWPVCVTTPSSVSDPAAAVKVVDCP